MGMPSYCFRVEQVGISGHDCLCSGRNGTGQNRIIIRVWKNDWFNHSRFDQSREGCVTHDQIA